MDQQRTLMSQVLRCGVTMVVFTLGAVGGVSGCGEESAGTPPAAPTDLMITAASRGAISLSWTTSPTSGVTGYRVERRSVGTTAFLAVADVTGAATTSYSDSTVDAYVAYTYRVRAVDVDALASTPSNEDTAGPPPAALQVAVAKPTDQGNVWQYGVHTSLVLDENDDPAIAYVGEFSTGGSGDVGKLYFVRWNRTDYRWDVPSMVDDQLGALTFDHPNRQASLARDASNGRYGLAYNVGYEQIWLAYSEGGGLNWTKEKIADRPNGEVSNPTLVMASDETHLAYWDWCSKAALNGVICSSDTDSHSVAYQHRSGTSGALTYVLSPSLPDTQDAKPWLDMALDDAGAPGIAYFLGAAAASPDWYNVTLAFWRPGQAAATLVTDTGNVQDDTSSVSLSFQGTSPRLAYHLEREASPAANDMWFSQSSDGITWSAPLGLPTDGGDRTDWYQSLATDSAGNATVAAYFSGSIADGQFGGPKLLRSSDLTTWTVSSPAPTTLPGFAGAYVDTAYAGNDKLNMVFFYDSGELSLGDGIIFWRAP